MKMSRGLIPTLILGLAGTALLVSLGVWQVQRLAWKEGILERIEDRIDDAPVPLDAATEDYQPVTASGRYGDQEIHVLASLKRVGAIYRIIAPFETEGGRRILVDRGFVPADQKDQTREVGAATIIGNLHTPDERDSFTPEPDFQNNVWYARDVPALARALNTEETFVILRETSLTDPQVTPLPVDTASIPNDHLGYAVTWFSLAIVWVGMTAAFVWRITRRGKR